MDGDHVSSNDSNNVPNSNGIEPQQKRNTTTSGLKNRRNKVVAPAASSSGRRRGDSSSSNMGSGSGSSRGTTRPATAGGRAGFVRKRTPKKQRRLAAIGAMMMLFAIGLLLSTGTMVISYVLTGSTNTKKTWSPQRRGARDVFENVLGIHDLLWRMFHVTVTAVNDKVNHAAYHAKRKIKKRYNAVARKKATKNHHRIHYDREQLQKDYEKETSHLPKFPQEYMGTKPPKDFDIQRDYKPLGGNRFEEYVHGKEPYHITRELILQSNELARARRKYIKAAMKHAYGGYEKYAFGMDEVKPQTRVGDNNWGGMAVTMLDALDTLWLMDMKDEFYRARDWVRDRLDHDRVGSVSVFETTIRSLGGLLAAYDWSHDEAFLDQAYDLGKRLVKAFDRTKTGIPYGQVELRGGKTSNIGWTGNNAILSEFGTLQVEFRYLAKAMDGARSTDVFARKTERVFELLDRISPGNGLFPYLFVNDARKELPVFANDHLTFGAMADSAYEYMLKTWLQGGQTEPMYREMYDRAIQGMHDELLQTSTPSGLVYIAEKRGSVIRHKMDHLVCFMGGLLALGAYTDPRGLRSDRARRDLETARSLTYTCYQMYARMSTGISPEYVHFTPDLPRDDFMVGSGKYLLRPEAVESFFVLGFLTNDPVYREWGWEVFQSIEKYCKTEIAYGSLDNVDVGIHDADNGGTNHQRETPKNKMESFFLAETLKYLYLLQDPDTEVDILNKHVFNTEAHPTRIFPVFDEEES